MGIKLKMKPFINKKNGQITFCAKKSELPSSILRDIKTIKKELDFTMEGFDEF